MLLKKAKKKKKHNVTYGRPLGVCAPSLFLLSKSSLRRCSSFCPFKRVVARWELHVVPLLASLGCRRGVIHCSASSREGLAAVLRKRRALGLSLLGQERSLPLPDLATGRLHHHGPFPPGGNSLTGIFLLTYGSNNGTLPHKL